MSQEFSPEQIAEQRVQQGRDFLLGAGTGHCADCNVRRKVAVGASEFMLESCCSVELVEPAFTQVMDECVENGPIIIRGVTPCTDRQQCQHPSPDPLSLLERVKQISSTSPVALKDLQAANEQQ